MANRRDLYFVEAYVDKSNPQEPVLYRRVLFRGATIAEKMSLEDAKTLARTKNEAGTDPAPAEEVHYLARAGTLHEISYTACGQGFNRVSSSADLTRVTCAVCLARRQKQA